MVLFKKINMSKIPAADFLKKACVLILCAAAAWLASLPLGRIAGLQQNEAAKGNLQIRLDSSLGSGMLVGLLGGYGALLSDFAWISAYLAWERKDSPKCLAAIDLAVALDPEMSQFWIQGARMIAYDMPHWKIAQLNKINGAAPSEEVKNAVHRRLTLEALRFLDRALKIMPDDQDIIAEKGQMYLNRLDDYAHAAECYGKIMKISKDPPVFVQRIYAGCLEKLGRDAESIAVLEDLLKILEKDEPLYPIITKQISSLKEKQKAAGLGGKSLEGN